MIGRFFRKKIIFITCIFNFAWYGKPNHNKICFLEMNDLWKQELITKN